MSRVPGTLSSAPKAKLWPGPIPGTHEPGFEEQPIVEKKVTADHRAAMHGPLAARNDELHLLIMGECQIALSRQPTAGGVLRWHLSISCRDRHPTWDEIKTAKYRLLGPDLVAAMILPPIDLYVNYAPQDHVFHLHEIEDDARPWEPVRITDWVEAARV